MTKSPPPYEPVAEQPSAKCPTCNGQGSVEDYSDPNGPDGWWVETCATCGGPGEIAA